MFSVLQFEQFDLAATSPAALMELRFGQGKGQKSANFEVLEDCWVPSGDTWVRWLSYPDVLHLGTRRQMASS
jgi:hypothetical protein